MSKFFRWVIKLGVIATLIPACSTAVRPGKNTSSRTPLSKIEALCGSTLKTQPQCHHRIGTQPVCQGIRRIAGQPWPKPTKVCVCDQCRTDSDCKTGERCRKTQSRCSAHRQICVSPAGSCALCPNPKQCLIPTDPKTGALGDPLCAPEPPVP